MLDIKHKIIKLLIFTLFCTSKVLSMKVAPLTHIATKKVVNGLGKLNKKDKLKLVNQLKTILPGELYNPVVGSIPEMEKEHTLYEFNNNEYNYVKLSKDGECLALSKPDGTIKIHDIIKNTYIKTLPNIDPIHKIKFIPGTNNIASEHKDKAIKCWNVITKNCEQYGNLHTAALAFSEFNQFTVIGLNGIVQIIFPNKQQRTTENNSIKEQPIKKHITEDHPIEKRIIGENIFEQHIISGILDRIISIKISPQGNFIANVIHIHSNTILKILNRKENKLIKLPLHGEFTFSPDEKYIAMANRRKIEIFDTQTGMLLQSKQCHESKIYSIHFSHDGKSFTSASEDKTIKVFNLQDYIDNGAWLLTLTDHKNIPLTAKFSKGNRYLLSVLWNGTSGNCISKIVKAWDLWQYLD